MEHMRFDTKFAQKPDATDPKQHLLNNASLSIAAVEMARYPTISFKVVSDVCIQKIEWHPPNICSPNLCLDSPFTDHYFDAERCIVITIHQVNWQFGRMRLPVVFFLPAIISQALTKVAIPIKETDCY